MKHTFYCLIGIFLLILISKTEANAQFTNLGTFKAASQVPDFSPLLNLELYKNEIIKETNTYLEQISEQNKANTEKLIDWIYNLKTQTNDAQFHSALNNYYKTLRSFEGQDFANLGSQIQQINTGIKNEIDKYNARMEELNNPQKYWDQGNQDSKNENFNNAIENFTRVIELSPDFIYGYEARGYAFYEIGNYKNAIEDFNKYLAQNSLDSAVFGWRGWSKYEMGDYTGALQDFNKQIDLVKNPSIGYYNRGSAKAQLRDFYGAIVDYNKAIELNSKFSMAYNNRGWAKFELKKYSDALIDVNKAIELDNTNWVAFDSRQEIKFNLNDLIGCIEDCNKAISINPKISNSFFFRGRANYKSGNKTAACEDWSKAGELGKSEAYDFIKTYCNN